METLLRVFLHFCIYFMLLSIAAVAFSTATYGMRERIVYVTKYECVTQYDPLSFQIHLSEDFSTSTLRELCPMR